MEDKFRIDDDGKWLIEGGLILLIEPSEKFIAQRELEEQQRLEDEKNKPLTKEQEMELKLTNLEQENLNIMLATTEMYEEQYNENLNLMLAITELYEMNMEV